MFNTMKNFDEYIIEKLRVTKNNKILTLGDIYKIRAVNISASAMNDSDRFLEKIDDLFGITKLYELQNEYTDYFKEYEDNIDPKIWNEKVKKICKILLNIIFSAPADMTIYDGLKILLDDCNIPEYERDLFKIESDSKLFFTNYLLVYFRFEER